MDKQTKERITELTARREKTKDRREAIDLDQRIEALRLSAMDDTTAAMYSRHLWRWQGKAPRAVELRDRSDGRIVAGATITDRAPNPDDFNPSYIDVYGHYDDQQEDEQ